MPPMIFRLEAEARGTDMGTHGSYWTVAAESVVHSGSRVARGGRPPRANARYR
jgi:hypothetical protein